MNHKREKWIDVYKGLAITTVPIAHILPEFRFLFMFHMPLFFFLSGYTFRKPNNLKDFFIKKSRRLLKPHVAYFILILLLNVIIPVHIKGYDDIIYAIKNFLYDTTSLTYDFGTFWFIPVLFISLILLGTITGFNIFSHNGGGKIFVLISLTYITALVFNYYNIKLWQAIQNIPLALFYILLGYISSKHTITEIDQRLRKVIPYIKALSIAMLLFLPFIPNSLCLDMKYAHFGIPIVSAIMSCISIYAVITISKMFSKNKTTYNVFAIIGMASIHIMYIHQFIHFRLVDIANPWIVTILSIGIPTLIFNIKTRIYESIR